MLLTKNKVKIHKSNFLLVAGNGRNVGKTFLACEIIKQLSQKNEVTGVKISPHFQKKLMLEN